MPCKFFSTGQVCKLLIVLLLAPNAHAQLDWDNDVIVFGTEQDEVNPLIVSMWNGNYRAICHVNGSTLRTRRSQMNGEAWEGFSDRIISPTTGFLAASDDQYTYVWHVGTTGLFRIRHDASAWPDETPTYVVDSGTNVYDCDAITDVQFDSQDTYLHGSCVYQSSIANTSLAYFRSEDRAQSVSIVSPVDSLFAIQDSSASVSTAVTWSGDDERIWIALTTDRPGTTGEQIRLYSSDDLGQSWAAPVTPDSSSYAMMRPALLGFGETIMLAYQRRNSASIARDIYMVYSPDNGVSWSEPLQLTNHAFDDVMPTLVQSSDRIGLLYARAQTQQNQGELFFRQSSFAQPWIWAPEVSVSSSTEFVPTEGYSATGNDIGFTAVWSSRVVGEDGDVLFDGSWRGVPVDQSSPDLRPSVTLRAEVSAGWIEIGNPLGVRGNLTLYNILGRSVARTQLAAGASVWKLPPSLPSGTYLLTHPDAKAIRVQVMR